MSTHVVVALYKMAQQSRTENNIIVYNKASTMIDYCNEKSQITCIICFRTCYTASTQNSYTTYCNHKDGCLGLALNISVYKKFRQWSRTSTSFTIPRISPMGKLLPQLCKH